MNELYPVAMFIVLLSFFFPVFQLPLPGGHALYIRGLGSANRLFDGAFLRSSLAAYGIMSNETPIAVPLFVFMGVVLNDQKLPKTCSKACRSSLRTLRGLGISVCLVGVYWPLPRVL